jgi:hypothetical protein
MRTTTRTILGLALAGTLIAACGAAAATLEPTGPTSPQATAQAVAAVATPAPTPAITPTPMITPTPVPNTDGTGDEVVRGTSLLKGGALVTDYATATVDGMTQLRGGVAEFTDDMNDARVSGTATWAFSVDLYTVTGPEWGPITITNDKGTWKGTCTGGVWSGGAGLAWSCWLTGSGDYTGYSYYRQVTKEASDGYAQVIGVVYPGAIPTQ